MLPALQLHQPQWVASAAYPGQWTDHNSRSLLKRQSVLHPATVLKQSIVNQRNSADLPIVLPDCSHMLVERTESPIWRG
jgi:hypothetical protein